MDDWKLLIKTFVELELLNETYVIQLADVNIPSTVVDISFHQRASVNVVIRHMCILCVTNGLEGKTV